MEQEKNQVLLENFKVNSKSLENCLSKVEKLSSVQDGLEAVQNYLEIVTVP
jgi:hypothetical protein